MQLALLCATKRGVLFLRELADLCSQDAITVITSPEMPGEPPYVQEIQRTADERGLRVFVATQVHHLYAQKALALPDLMLAVNWRYLVPRSWFERLRLGFVVFHDSLLPKYRGFSPTVWAIVNGERRVGATMFYATEEVDAGDIIDQIPIDITEEDDISSVFERISMAYVEMLKRNIDSLKNGSGQRIPQQHSEATYCCRRIPEDNEIDWKRSATEIYNLVRAVTKPYPGAFTYLPARHFPGATGPSMERRRLTVWSCERLPGYKRYVGAIPGAIIETWPGKGAVVLTGDGALLLKTVQVEGQAEACAADVLRSLAIRLGR